MKYNVSATRLTLYALISAIEMDLRSFIINNINEVNEKLIIDEELEKKLNDRSKKDMQFYYEIETKIEYMDFGDCVSIINKFKKVFPDSFKNDIQEIIQALNNIIPIRNRVMHSRPLEFTDLTNVVDFVSEHSNSKLIMFRETIDIKNQINNNPAIVFSLKIPEFKEESDEKIYNNLPPVEFDDTGFIGRKKDIDIIKNKISGNHNVISVIGDGGIGKTALVLKCMYDILDNDEQIFDAIIWVSLKTRTLSNGEFINIKNSINSTLGVYEEIKNMLIGSIIEDEKNIMESIIEYMTEFKVLLVLDNFETINSDDVREFFDKIPNGSKVVITSRIGVGEFETRHVLGGLNSKERISYVKRLAQSYNLIDILKLDENEIDKICERVYSNPLAIKWIIASIFKGVPIEVILTHTEELTNYCMSNVYDKLSLESKKILEVMLIYQKECGQAEIGYLIEMDSIKMNKAINELLTTNMMRMRTISEDGLRKSLFSITEFAREYLIQYCRPSQVAFKNINKKIRELKGLGQNLNINADVDPYNPRSITFSSRSDELLAAYNLLQALTASSKGDSENAYKYIEKAKQISPNYFEVYKISAFIEASKGNTFAADEEYKIALQCKNNNAPLLFLYAGFRMRFLDDFETALEYLNVAHSLDSENLDIKIQIARVYMLLNKYDIADDKFTKLLMLDTKFKNKQKRITVNYSADNARRWAELLVKKEEYEQAFNLLEKAIHYINMLDENEKDSKVISTVCKIMGNLVNLATLVSYDSQSGGIDILCNIFDQYKYKLLYNELYKSAIGSINKSKINLSDGNKEKVNKIVEFNTFGKDENEGIIFKIRKGYGFIRNQKYDGLFFHYGDCIDDFSGFSEGQKVKFVLSSNEKGMCATSITKCI